MPVIEPKADVAEASIDKKKKGPVQIVKKSVPPKEPTMNSIVVNDDKVIVDKGAKDVNSTKIRPQKFDKHRSDKHHHQLGRAKMGFSG